jgi:regulatory helix-turn-helix LysR family protein/LysR substrate binding domain-containing protein
MDLKQLEMFIAVYEEQSFHRAAARVRRTQPALSLALLKLEREIGTRLLERGRGWHAEYHLTRAGELVYGYASRMIGLRNEVAFRLGTAKSRPAEYLRVGISAGWLSGWVVQAIGGFRRGHPYVQVEVCCGPTEALAREVRERKIDLAILDTVKEIVHGNSGVQWIEAKVRWDDSRQARTAWLLRNRTGQSYAAAQFEEKLRSSTSGAAGVSQPGKERKKPLLKGRPPRETSSEKTGTAASRLESVSSPFRPSRLGDGQRNLGRLGKSSC